MKNKFLIVGTVVILAVGGLLGCSKRKDKYKPETDWREYVAVEEVKLSYSAKERYPDKAILNWILPIGACEDNGSAVYDEFNRLLDKKGYPFAVDFYVLQCDGEEYYRRIRSMKYRGLPVDIFNVGFDYFGGVYDLCIEEGLCASWNEYFKTEEGRKLYLSKNDRVWKALSDEDVIYGIAGNVDAPVSEHYSYYFNERLLKQYGWDANELASDSRRLVEAVNSVAEEGIIPCGLISRDDIFVFPDYISVMPPIAYSMRDDRYVNIAMTEEGRSWLKLYAANRIKIVEADSLNRIESFFLIVEQHRGANVPRTEYGGVVQVNSNAYGINITGNVNCVAEWSKKREDAFSLLNAIHTDVELSQVLAYGIKGVNYETRTEKIEVIEPYSVWGELFLSNWSFFREKKPEEQEGYTVYDGGVAGKRLSLFACYREMIKAEDIYLNSVPTATDNKLWGKDNFSEKMDSLAKEFEKAGGDYLLKCLNNGDESH